MLSDQAIRLEWLTRTDVDIALRVEDFQSTLFTVTDASLPVRAIGGRMSMGPFSGTVNSGWAEFDLVVDANDTPISIDLNLTLEAVDLLARAGIFDGSERVANDGGTDATLSLNGRGNSLASFLATANADGSVYVRDLLFKHEAVRLISSDLLYQLIDVLNPNENRLVDTRFDCAATRFAVVNGQVTMPAGYALESDDFAIIGDGRVDLANETLDLDFQSIPRKGLGIGLNKLTTLVKLDGPLAKPELTFNDSGLLRFGATVVATIYTRGLSLLAEGLWDKHMANSSLCKKALTQ